MGYKQVGHDIGVVRLKTALNGVTTRILTTASTPASINFLGYHRDLTRFQMYFSAGKYGGWESSAYRVFKTDADAHRGSSGAGVALPKEIMRISGIMQGGDAHRNIGIWFDDARVDKVYSWVNAAL